jgi:class 3 adenylate cyclase
VVEMSVVSMPSGTVTFLFSDIEGSSDLVRRVGDDVFAAIRRDHRRLLRETFAVHGGREVDTAGDGFFVAFDSARSAVAAAVGVQLALATFAWPADAEVLVRIGLHTAEPHQDDDGYVGIGVHRAARICDAARGGQILVSNATAGIIEDSELQEVELVDLGTHHLSGLPRAQRLFQVTVEGLRARFDRPRTETATRIPGIGTFLATNLSGFQHVVRLLGDEASAVLAAEYQALVSGAVETGNGIVVERVGDNVLAVFPDASDAVQTAAVVREELADFAWPAECEVAVSIAVHSGRWSGDPQRLTANTALYRLTCIAQTVKPGQVLISYATAALLEGDRSAPELRDLGERAIPNFDEPARVYELERSTIGRYS